MPLKPLPAEKGRHARERERELEEVLRRAEEAGFFAGCATYGEASAKASELLPRGFVARRMESFDEHQGAYWSVHWTERRD